MMKHQITQAINIHQQTYVPRVSSLTPQIKVFQGRSFGEKTIFLFTLHFINFKNILQDFFLSYQIIFQQKTIIT